MNIISFFEKKPKIDDIDFADDYFKTFKSFDIETIPNLVFNGHRGSGKTTKIYSLLCSLLDNKVYTLKNNEIEIEKRIFKFKSSIYHLEIDCLELLNNERIFFNQYLREYCESRNIGLDIPKIIYFINIEKIHKNSLLYLRKMIESTYQSAKYIFETTNLSMVPNTLISRFLIIRVRIPNREKIEIVMKNIIKENKIKISKSILNKIIDNDLKYRNHYDLNNIFLNFNYYIETKKLLVNNYYNTIDEIINIITSKKIDFIGTLHIKSLCEKIFINCYDANELVLCITNILMNKYNKNTSKCEEIIKLSNECHLNLQNSTGKYFIHLENYLIKLIILLQKN
jgi:hypothetical protein